MKDWIKGANPAILLFILSLLLFPVKGESGVRIWEETLKLPTYIVGEPDHNPRFYSGRAYQGAQGRVYPYPMIDSLSDDRKEVSYKAVYMENEFIKVCVVPEIGGRILSAIDKTNNYDFFYRQTVIKPALIGMVGAWISGGVEWNFPHHHRPSVFMHIDYTTVKNPDGSATIWVGEMEIRHRMRWAIGLTIYPGKSFIEATLKPINRTPFIQSFLFFANVGIHSNEDYQVFFPPGTDYATYHGKNQFAHWPISNEIFNRIDYSKGVDVSWWKNHPEWTSMFAWNYKDDFFGGYDHGKEAGTVSVANHHIAPGKKFWEWSAGPRGELWDHILTEKDGPELELMSGAYSDNQPDYSWLQPMESKIVRLYWFPIRELGGLKYANLHGATNLEMKKDGEVFFAFNTVEQHKDAVVVLKNADKRLFSKKIDIGPGHPFSAKVELPDQVKEKDLEISLNNSSGDRLLEYRSILEKREPMPDPVKPPGDPRQVSSVEELYLSGQRLEQFYNPAIDPVPYYEEALRSDPGHYDSNLALGIRYFKQGKFTDAEKLFRTAVKRVTYNHTNPRDGEALYYLGLVLRFQNRHTEAVKPLFKSTWSYAFHTAAYYQLAEISSLQRDYSTALDQINRALATNRWSGRSLNLKSAILRRLNRPEASLALTQNLLKVDPLNFWAGYEHYLARNALNQEGSEPYIQQQMELMRGETQSFLELAVDYSNGGFWDEAKEVINRLIDSGNKPASNPMLYYYLGYVLDKEGESDQAKRSLEIASQQPRRYCFPFRLESINVLSRAFEVNPRDAAALYYLGNLLYDHQPGVAIHHWERSLALNSDFPTLHRNLGIGYQQFEGNVEKAIKSLETAVRIDTKDARLFYELDVFYERGAVSVEKRLSVLEENRETILKRDDSYSRLALVYVQLGRYDEAIEILTKRHFHVWEGSRGLRDAYVNAYLLRGLSHFRAKAFEKALADYQKALEFPLNLENAWPYRGGRLSEIYYFIATGYEALEQSDKANDFFRKSAEAKQQQDWSDLRYYQSLSLKKIGKRQKAEQILRGLMEFASQDVDPGVGFFSKFGEKESLNVRQARKHYLRALCHEAQDDRKQAESEIQKVLELDVNHLWARIKLDQLR